jgi:DNA-binding NarL/FixJ family response regulator
MHRVFILCDHGLFGQGVHSLLRQSPEIEIVGWEEDPRKAVEQIRALRPAIVVAGCGDTHVGLDREVTHLLDGELGIHLICLDLQSNSMFIYRKEEKTVKEVGDLIQEIASFSKVRNDIFGGGLRCK